MDARDRVRLTLTCKQPDRVPVALGFFPQSFTQIAPTEPEDYFDLDIGYVSFDQSIEQKSFIDYMKALPDDVYVGWQERLQTYQQWNYHPEREAGGPLSDIRGVEEIAEWTPPRVVDIEKYPVLKSEVAKHHRLGRAVAAAPPNLGGVLFEAGYRLRGFESFLTDLADRTELAEYLLDQLAAVLLESALLLAEAEVDVLMLGDDVALPDGLIISPEMWREIFGPRLKSVIEAARDVSPELTIFYHSDGDFTQLIPDLIEVGINAINPVQPDCMDPAAIKQAYGERLAIWGSVGTAMQWDLGTPDVIRNEVRERINALAPDGGYVLAPAYDLCFAPFENIVAFCETAREHG